MRIRLLVCLVGVVSLAGLLSAQGPVAGPQDNQTRGGQIDINVLNVPLMVLVTDNKGKLITNLTREDFRIYEDDKPQTIRNFARPSSILPK